MKEEILTKIYNANKNLIVSGDISIGKTVNVGLPLVGKYIERKESFLVIDSKEEYINKFYEKVKNNGYNTVIINLRDLKQSEGWNLLEYPYNLYKNGETDKSLNYLEQIGRELFNENNSGDPFWSMTASDFFTGVVLGLFEDAKKEEINLSSVNAMFNGVDTKYGNSDYITEYFKFKQPTDISYNCASATVFAPKDTKGSIISVAKQKLRVLVTRELLSKMLSKTTFDFNDIINKPTAIFLIAKDEETYINSLVPIFINQLYSILIDNKVLNKFNFVIENFDSIKNVSGLVDMLSSCISRNIKFTIFTRSKEDMEQKYGSYINKLVNNIKVKEKSIDILINDENVIIENVITIQNNEKGKIEYPQMLDNKCLIFDLRKFVNDKLGTNSLNSLDNKTDNFSNIDNLISRIDSKIEELNQQEKLEKIEKKNIDIKSDFEQFKEIIND